MPRMTTPQRPPITPPTRVNTAQLIEGLDRNENLNKLDFTVNFIDVDGLLTIARLKHNFALRELCDPPPPPLPPRPCHYLWRSSNERCRYLTGNPCTQWEHFRAYVIAQLPQVTKLDGKNVMPSERIDAQQRLQVQQYTRALTPYSQL